MGNKSAPKYISAWIDEIPDSKLEGGIRDRGTIWTTIDFRLDCQETIHHEPARYNLQIQYTHSTIKKVAPKSMAFTEAPVNDPWTAEKIREELKNSVTGFPLAHPSNSLSK
jgi:hypothetical protein